MSDMKDIDLQNLETVFWEASNHGGNPQIILTAKKSLDRLRAKLLAAEKMREALEVCEAQFNFYADEHLKAQKLEKSSTNRKYALVAQKALAAWEDA